MTCLYVYGYPKIVDRHWLNTLCNNRGTVTTIDVATVDSYNAKKDLRKSIAEYRGRERTAKNSLDAMDAADKRDELSTLVRDVNYGEVIKRMTTRVFLADTNYENLMKTVRYYKKNVFEDNEYQVAINLNEMQYEWTSMFKSYSMQSADHYSRRTGKSIASSTLAGVMLFILLLLTMNLAPISDILSQMVMTAECYLICLKQDSQGHPITFFWLVYRVSVNQLF